MTKYLLLKYIKGEATKEEEQKVIEWVERSSDNKRYLISLNNLWLSQNIPSTTASVSEFEELRSLTAEKKTNYWRKVLPYAAAVIIFVLVGTNILLLRNMKKESASEDRILLTQIPTEKKVTIYTNYGVKGFVILPDNSEVWLNSGSKITYPAKFTGPTREVSLSGEAYFEVTKDAAKPMIVSTNKKFHIEVLGTKFNLRAYDDDNDAETTLYSGAVRIKTETRNKAESKEIMMKPMETVRINGNNLTSFSVQKDIIANVAWKDGVLVFDNSPMNEVIKKIERWHGTSFVVKDSTILSYRITASFNSESTIQIMEMLKYISPVDFNIIDNTVFISKR